MPSFFCLRKYVNAKDQPQKRTITSAGNVTCDQAFIYGGERWKAKRERVLFFPPPFTPKKERLIAGDNAGGAVDHCVTGVGQTYVYQAFFSGATLRRLVTRMRQAFLFGRNREKKAYHIFLTIMYLFPQIDINLLQK